MHWKTKIVQPQELAPKGFRSLCAPVYRGSTVLFSSQNEVRDGWEQKDNSYTYGLYGTPTVLELGARVAQLEGALHSFVVPGGQAAIALVYLSLCHSGSHVLVPYSAYAPNKDIANGMLKRLGVDVEYYDPSIGYDIKSLFKDNTVLIWTESPGSVTMEIQDIPAICQAAHENGILVALDNTYSAGVFFDAFGHGVDISIQALTKYIGGHSDILLGTVSVNSSDLKITFGETFRQLGLAVSPDDSFLAIRGLQTLSVRLSYLEFATLKIAEWLSECDAIEAVYHPALPSCPGHGIWKRDFTGSTSVFSFLFKGGYTPDQVAKFVDSLNIFKIGMSWGGVTSLALVYPDLDRPHDYGGRLVRLNIGLEHVDDLILDLKNAISEM